MNRNASKRRRDNDEEPIIKPPSATFQQLDRVIHEKARLEIMTSLAMHSHGLLFSDLKEICDLTDGNLNRHLKVLVSSEMVVAWKSEARKRQTMYRLTKLGKQAFQDYLAALESIVTSAQTSVQAIHTGDLGIQGS